jgi:hypothetical protein
MIKKQTMKKQLFAVIMVLLFCIGEGQAFTSDSLYVRAHFLCGSKPKRKYKKEERRWFGGVLGGHAGVEIAPNYIIDFGPRGGFHVFSHKRKRHSRYTTHDTTNFYQLFGAHRDSVQRMVITIPITVQQKKVLDSLAKDYLQKTPYDYAFFGMRCGAAAYDVLSQIGIVEKFSVRKTRRKIFYPRKLRRRLMKKAGEKGWTISRQKGTSRRRWEKE